MSDDSSSSLINNAKEEAVAAAVQHYVHGRMAGGWAGLLEMNKR